MGRGKVLTREEQGKIAALSMADWNVSRISRALNRSRNVIRKYFNDPKQYDTKRTGGPKLKLTGRQKGLMFREVSKGIHTARQLRDKLQLPVGLSHVRRLLNSSGTHKYMKMISAPPLTDAYKKDRVEWAKIYVTLTPKQ